MRLTRQAHEAVAAVVGEGSLALDATAGNGHDTCFLAEQVGVTGHVWALDIQRAAIDATHSRLAEADLDERVTLVCDSHARVAEQVKRPGGQYLDAVMFNLGYLPGSDHARVTQPESTICALEQSMELLAPGGCLSLMVYRGHEGGEAEWRAIRSWLEGGGLSWRVPADPSGHNGPVLVLVTR